MIKKFLLHAFIILITASTFVLTSAAPPRGVGAAETGTISERTLELRDKNGNLIQCGTGQKATGVMLGYIVPCVAGSIEHATVRFSQAMVDMLKPTFYSFLVLVITLFGVKILQGGGQLHNEGMLLLLKIALVVGCLQLLPGTFVPLIYDIMTDSQEIVAQTISPTTSDINCDVAKYQGTNTPLIWAEMDCLLGKLYGISVGGTDANGVKQPSMLLMSSIFGLLAGFFFGGTFGAILFLACVGVLWTMLVIIVRVASGFLNAYLHASMMLIIAPIFMPLILLKASAQYFEPWWKAILAALIMPVIITSYAMFAMLLYDRMLFSPTALIHDLFDNDLMKQMVAASPPVPLCSSKTAGNSSLREEVTGLKESAMVKNNPYMTMMGQPALGGFVDNCLEIQKPNVQMQAVLDVKSNKEAFVKMFTDAMKLLVLSILIATGYTNMLSLIRLIVGSGSVASTLDPQGSIEKKFAYAQAAGRKAFIGSFYDRDAEGGKQHASGSEFINRLPTVPERIFTGIKDSLDRS